MAFQWPSARLPLPTPRASVISQSCTCLAICRATQDPPQTSKAPLNSHRPPRRSSPHSNRPPLEPRQFRQAPGVHSRRLLRLARIGDIPALDAAIEAAHADGFFLNAVNYTTIANARVAAGDGAEALNWLRKMRAERVGPTNATIRVGFKAAKSGEELAELLEWFRKSASEDAECKTWNMGISRLARICRPEEEAGGLGATTGAVLENFAGASARSDGHDSEGAKNRNSEDPAWNEIIRLFGIMHESGRFKERIQRARMKNVRSVPEPDVYTYNAVLKACQTRGDFSTALGIFGRLLAYPNRVARPDIVTYNTLLAILLTRASFVDECGVRIVSLMRKISGLMKRDGVEPDMITCTLLFQVLTCRHRELLPVAGLESEPATPDRFVSPARLGNLAPSAVTNILKSFGLYRQEDPQASSDDSFAMNSRLGHETYSTLSRSPHSRRTSALIYAVWRSASKVKADKIFYNALIAAFARVGDTMGAVKALHEMREKRNLSADLYTYNALLCAAGRSGDVPLAKRLLEKLRASQLYSPDAFSYSAALSSCRGGYYEDSQQMLASAVEEGVSISPPMLNAALQCHRGNIESALAQWGKWRTLKGFDAPSGDAQVYRALLRVAGMAGRPDQALRVVLAGKKLGEIDPATTPGLFRAFSRGMREGEQGSAVRENIISKQYLRHLRLECRAFDNSETSDLPIERVRIKW